MKKKILFLTQYDEQGASSRIRIYQFLPYFEESGFSVFVKPLINKKGQKLMNTLAVEKNLLKLIFLLFQIFFQFFKRYIHVIQAWSYDLVVVQKDVLPFALRFLLKLGQKKVVFEIDDAIWLPHNSIGKKGTIQKAIASYRKHCLSGVLKSSTAVITDNSFLTEYARKYCHNVLTLTAPIDSQKYKVQHNI